MSTFQPPPVASGPVGMSPSGPPGKVSALAVTSLVLGCLGIFTGGLLGMVGLILGIIALILIARSAGALRGNALAIAGLSVSAFSMLFGCLLLSLLLPALGQAVQTARDARAQSHLAAMLTAHMSYAADFNDRLPPSDDWVNVLVSRGFAMGPLDPAPPSAADCQAFTLNKHLEGIAFSRIPDPARTVVLFESAPGSPPAGGRELLPSEPIARRKGYLIGFADGHGEHVPADGINALVWKP